jgi:hypothetical protein
VVAPRSTGSPVNAPCTGRPKRVCTARSSRGRDLATETLESGADAQPPRGDRSDSTMSPSHAVWIRVSTDTRSDGHPRLICRLAERALEIAPAEGSLDASDGLRASSWMADRITHAAVFA